MGSILVLYSTENCNWFGLSAVELVLMEMVSDKLISTPLQFGFKANSSCNHAIFTLPMVAKHYCSILSLCALDISKAFDRVDIYGLLNALIPRRFPRIFVEIMKSE